jgi:hypothetical protein
MAEHAETVLASAAKVASDAGVECQIFHRSAEHPYAAILNVANDRGCDLHRRWLPWSKRDFVPVAGEHHDENSGAQYHPYPGRTIAASDQLASNAMRSDRAADRAKERNLLTGESEGSSVTQFHRPKSWQLRLQLEKVR